ncbi:unnamed protein product [Dicrocoelium dendriticum]|nr:unnamed protein product [Dicrocoelium dendriticum]
MERRRRACISHKMNALHSLAMNIVGLDPEAQHKAEKVDILTTCCKVLEHVAKVAREQPVLQSWLHQFQSKLPELTAAATFTTNVNSHSRTHPLDLENIGSSGFSPSSCLEIDESNRPIPSISSSPLTRSVSNSSSSVPPTPMQKSRSCYSTDSGVCSPHENTTEHRSVGPGKNMLQQNQRFVHFRTSFAQTDHSEALSHRPYPFRSPLSSVLNRPFQNAEFSLEPAVLTLRASPPTAFRRVETTKPTGTLSVWRPYL